MNACPKGLDGFHYAGGELFSDQTILAFKQKKAFIISTSSSSNVNVHELDVLLVAFDI